MATVELYGVLRLKAGTNSVCVKADSVRTALQEVERCCPSLQGELIVDGRIPTSYRLSLNGLRFLSDLSAPINEQDSLLLITADPGG